MPGGHPSTYTEEVADRICMRIADGESLSSICRSEEIPARSTVFKWLSENPEFSDKYARAREFQADAFADDISDIADDGRNDWMERNGQEDAGWQANGEHIQRSKLRVDARKWAASKLRPKKYGDRVQVGGDPESPLIPETSDRDIAKAVAAVMAKGLKAE